MVYADFEYYSSPSGYGGSLIAESEFGPCVKWASAILDEVTKGRVKAFDSSKITDSIRDAVCAAAECWYKHQKALTKLDDLGRVRTSENNDGFSVSFSDSSEENKFYSEAATKKAAVSSIRTYLSGTGLCYRGRSWTYDYS